MVFASYRTLTTALEVLFPSEDHCGVNSRLLFTLFNNVLFFSQPSSPREREYNNFFSLCYIYIFSRCI